ncbi:hypothetical protein ASG67_05885 [Sphingomonas sp. Leaf339]|uniref:hypothetical protein n=1 Tax=Sphingomonas sp. Leaf339 TaxID=1736343 RepID=UPI0006FF1EDD|nr:hypothetical protein [Sphingomonas sp. Leaf339]KQU55668.1 hypothetical protein ASG67_05885 [Sphingomonas sp. Leaf339]
MVDKNVGGRAQDREIVLGSNALRRAAAVLAMIATQEERDDEPGDLHRLSHWLGLVGRQDDACYLRTYP